MKQVFIVATLIALMLSGCTKFGKNITVKGRVLNPVTGEGIPNIQIQIVREGGGIPGGYKEVKSTVTDSKGNFEISKLGLFQNYYIQAQTPLYPIGWKEDGQPKGDFRAKISKHHVVEMDYHTVPYGNQQIHVKNINCLGPTDTLRLYLDGSQIGFDDAQIGLLTELTGCIDITDSPVKLPIGERYYHWEVIKGGNSQIFYDTITLIEGQNVTLNIFY